MRDQAPPSYPNHDAAALAAAVRRDAQTDKTGLWTVAYKLHATDSSDAFLAALTELFDHGPHPARAAAIRSLHLRAKQEVLDLVVRLLEAAPAWLSEPDPLYDADQARSLGNSLVQIAVQELPRLRPQLLSLIEDVAATHGGWAPYAMHRVNHDPTGSGVEAVTRWSTDHDFPGQQASGLGVVYGSYGKQALPVIAERMRPCSDADVRAFYAEASRDMALHERLELTAMLRPAWAEMSDEVRQLLTEVGPLLEAPTDRNIRALHRSLRGVEKRLTWRPWGGLGRVAAKLPGIRWVWEQVADTCLQWLQGDDLRMQQLALAMLLYAPDPRVGRAVADHAARGPHRAVALSVLVELGLPKSADLFRHRTHDANAGVREIAILGLVRVGSWDQVLGLRQRLGPQSPAKDIDTFLLGLGPRTEPEAGQWLLERLDDPELAPQTWLVVRNALWEQGERVLEALCARAKGEDEALAVRAIEALAHADGEGPLTTLVEYTTIEPFARRTIAAHVALARRRGDRHGLRRLLREVDPWARPELAARLAALGDEAGLRHFLPSLFDRPAAPWLRQTLMELQADHRSALRQLIADPDPKVAEAAQLLWRTWTTHATAGVST